MRRREGQVASDADREAGDMGRYVHNIHAYPGIMITIQLDDQDDIIELALMLQQILHECGVCNCEDPLPKRGE